MAELTASPYLVVGDTNGFLCVWDIWNGKHQEPEHCFEAHAGAIRSVIVLRSGRVPELVQECEWPKSRTSGVESPTDDLRNPKMNTLEEDSPSRGRLCGATRRLLCCCGGSARNRDARHWYVATASEDGAVRVWRWRLIPKAQRKLATGPHESQDSIPFEVDFITEWVSDSEQPVVSCLELHDGHLAAGIDGSADVRIVDPGTSEVRSLLYGHTAPVKVLAECPDGRLATGGLDGAVRLWAKRFWEHDVKLAEAECHVRPIAWGDHNAELPGSGVSSMAFFAHMQQAQKGECVEVSVRIMVQRAENLPKADLFSASDPYVIVTVVNGDPGVTESRTPAKRSLRWDHRCTLTLRKTLVDGEWVLPECTMLDFEVYADATMCSKSVLLGHWAVSVDTIFAEIAQNPSEASHPLPRKLYAPDGLGPYQDLRCATVFVGFERLSELTIDCIIECAEGLPVAIGQRCFVKVAVRQARSRDGLVRCFPVADNAKTRIVNRNSDPLWDQVLEVNVSAFIMHKRIIYTPDLFLHFEVYDYDTLTADDLLGTLTLPLESVQQLESKDVQPFDLTLAPGMKPTKPKGGIRCSEPAESVSRLFLGFQFLTPCPSQLRVTIESGHALPQGITGPYNCMLRTRLVEGNQMVSNFTSARTTTCFRSRSPVWNERVSITVPAWLWRHQAHTRPTSDEPRLAVCVDIYDQEILGKGDDVPIGRATVPIEEALSAASDGSGRKSQAVPISCCPLSSLYLGFDVGRQNDELVVVIDRADRLPSGGHAGDWSADAYCIVRLVELGAFGLPTDLKQSNTLVHGVFSGVANIARRQDNPVWNHEELLDLPGIELAGRVAVRPNWYILFEVLDADAFYQLATEKPLMQATVPLTDILSEVASIDSPTTQSRINALRTSPGATNSIAQKKPTAAATVVRELPLFQCRANELKASKGATADTKPDTFSKREKRHSWWSLVWPFGAEREADLPPRQPPLDGPRAAAGTTAVDEAASPSSAGTLTSGKSSPSSSRFKATLLNAATGVIGQATNKIGKTLSDFGVFEDAPSDISKPSEGQASLVLRFQVVSRWNGESHAQKRPKPKSMPGPSPVTCLLTLASTVIAGYENGNVFIWDSTGSTGGVPLHQFEAHRVPISDMAFLPGLDCLLTTSLGRSREECVSDSMLRLWSCVNFELRQTVSLECLSSRCILQLSGVKQHKRGPCIALAMDTHQQNSIQLMKLARE